MYMTQPGSLTPPPADNFLSILLKAVNPSKEAWIVKTMGTEARC